MFTGLIEEVGEVRWLRAASGGTQLQIAAPRIGPGLTLGESVAVNGCCLTITAMREEKLTFDLLQETLERTNLRHLRPGSLVNLESALAASGRMGGHFVQGHIDSVIRVLDCSPQGADNRLEVELPADFARYVVKKGSIGLNGVSLTVAELRPHSLTVWIIPHTGEQTNLRSLRPGDLLNVEFDLLAKYVERMLAAR